MKVLVTGASGFVGSHVLDRLREEGIPAAALLRPSSSRIFLERHTHDLEVRQGSIEQPSTLSTALEGITHVIHCAGRTSACRSSEFYETNQAGTRNLVDAVNARNGQIARFLHISSLAVSGPGTSENPCRENGPTRPISEYGRSKLAAEKEVVERCRTDWVIVRPPAVYGPRDNGFLPLFKAVKSHLLPKTNATQALSLVYVEDLAAATVAAFKSPSASRKIYFAASPEVVTARDMAGHIARLLGTWTIPVPLPALLLWPMCASQELYSRLTGKARMLNLQKFAELRAPGWVCSPERLASEVGYRCPTNLATGVAQTLNWYQQQHWL